MTDRFILTLICLATFLFSLSQKNTGNKILNGMFLVSIAITVIKSGLFFSLGFIGLTITIISSVVFTLINKHYRNEDKILAIVTGTLVFLQMYTQIAHIPIGIQATLALLIPVIFYIIMLIRSKSEWFFGSNFFLVMIGYCILTLVQRFNILG